jgi:NAD(P)-dependent dehydrogenase (short-subunit alcohol dehydrogenase family)
MKDSRPSPFSLAGTVAVITGAIRANTVSPGWMETPLAGGMFRREDGSVDPERREQVMALLESASPPGITGVPGDIAVGVPEAGAELARDAGKQACGAHCSARCGKTAD